MRLTSAGKERTEAGVRLVSSLLDEGIPIAELLADRGYTYRLPEDFHLPLRERGVELVMDLHKADRVQRPIDDGVIYIDGAIFPTSLPQSMRRLTAPSPFTPKDEADKLRRAFDERAKFAFRLHQTLADGRQVWRGPAYTNSRIAPTVKCKNWPKSTRYARPLRETTCDIGEDCACGRFLTLGVDELAKTHQREVWGTTAWWESYARRTNVEAANSMIKHHYEPLSRHYTRVFGRTKNAFLLIPALVASNLEQSAAYRFLHGLAAPGSSSTSVPSRRRQRKRRSDATAGYDQVVSTDKPPP